MRERGRVDKRLSRLSDLGAPVEYDCKGVIGTGHAGEFAQSGVCIRRANTPVEEGDVLQIRFSIFPGSFSIVFHGEVVRKTPDGFEIRFVDLGPQHLEVLRQVPPSS